MVANTDTRPAGTYAVVNQHSTSYNVSPFINGFGGYILDGEGNPGLNDPKTIEAVEYNKKFADLQADGDYNTVTTLFNEGKAQAIIGGPWLVSGIRAAGIDLGVASLSDMTLPNGEPLAPFSGVQGIGVMKVAAEEKGDAIALALEALASPEVGVALAKAGGCAPANSLAYDDPDVAADEIIMAIEHTADTAQPMPERRGDERHVGPGGQHARGCEQKRPGRGRPPPRKRGRGPPGHSGHAVNPNVLSRGGGFAAPFLEALP